jgi:hypothetical protein
MTTTNVDLLNGLTAAREHLDAGLARANDNYDHIWKQQRPIFSKKGPERQREDDRHQAHSVATKTAADIVIRYKTALASVNEEIERLTVSLAEQHFDEVEPEGSGADFVEDDPPDPHYVRRAWQRYLNLVREDRARVRSAGGGVVDFSPETRRAMAAYLDAVDTYKHGATGFRPCTYEQSADGG